MIRLLAALAEAALFTAGRAAGAVIVALPGTNALCDRLAAHPIPTKYHHLLEETT